MATPKLLISVLARLDDCLFLLGARVQKPLILRCLSARPDCTQAAVAAAKAAPPPEAEPEVAAAVDELTEVSWVKLFLNSTLNNSKLI